MCTIKVWGDQVVEQNSTLVIVMVGGKVRGGGRVRGAIHVLDPRFVPDARLLNFNV